MENVDIMIKAVQGYIARCLAPLADRVKSIEAKYASGELNGKDGIPGRDGVDGKDGVLGGDGKDGAMGQMGAAGPQGDPGIDGRDGLDGPRGKDAMELDVCDTIDVSRSYQRGTLAVHRGGLVRAYKSTDPLDEGASLEKAGWHVLVCGIADLSIGFEDERTLSLSFALTDGRTVSQQKSFPVTIDRGVFRDGEYKAGDGVTWNGSYWIAQKDSPEGKPGDGEGWRLAVKKGRDGKDFAPPVAVDPPIVRLR